MLKLGIGLLWWGETPGEPCPTQSGGRGLFNGYGWQAFVLNEAETGHSGEYPGSHRKTPVAGAKTGGSGPKTPDSEKNAPVLAQNPLSQTAQHGEAKTTDREPETGDYEES